MRRVSITLDRQALDTGKTLVSVYGPSTSLSAVIRRALAMLSDQWANIDSKSLEAVVERGEMTQYLAVSQRAAQPK